MKIILDKSALERLVEGKPEFEVQISQAALRWLSDKKVKPTVEEGMANLDVVLRAAVQAAMEKCAEGRLKWKRSESGNSWGGSWELSREMKGQLTKAAGAELRKIFDDIRYAKIAELRTYAERRIEQFKEWLDSEFKKKAAEALTAAEADLLDARVESAVERVLKRRLGG